ncbi:hypothetical protein MKW94_001174 [Papaver nudicaule]|uniref:Uncharacterized protein n=1 Tax=Papaver nudicaule TaxID=74823 RepID=A0AA41W1G3_PAPNU|nr:hypothetical protein [Papaver nudicaule]
MTMDRKCEEVYEPLGRVGRLRSRVNNFIQILTATEQSRLDKTATDQSRLDKRLDDWVVSEAVNGNKKRKCFAIPAKNKKLVDRKEVEDGLLKVLKEVGGKTLESSAVSTEFRMKWDSIVDDFTILLDYF